MPQARRSTKQKVVSVAAALGVPDGPVYLNTKFVATLGLDPEVAQARLTDAATVHAQIAEPWTTQDTLVKWAQDAWGLESQSVDRLNAALALLQKLNRVFVLG